MSSYILTVPFGVIMNVKQCKKKKFKNVFRFNAEMSLMTIVFNGLPTTILSLLVLIVKICLIDCVVNYDNNKQNKCTGSSL